ncbi:MAG: DUF4878 domain-containing protein [Chitinophagaceae bacterium]|nr:MAG: DUF4878 domain-containing protein [Chitinophagaceae bacterium]
MKKSLIASALLLSLAACNSEDKVSEDSDLNVATSFVQSALKGDFRTAEKYLVDDSLNKQDLEQVARLNERLTKQEKDSYSGATVHIHEHRKVNDSTSIISYSNSYRNKVDSLKVVKLNGKWLVDFKYIFNQHTDTLQ